MDTQLIILDDILKNSKIEASFVLLLESEGLINITIVEGQKYIPESQLVSLERFANLYYDLSINIEGLDVIQNLLQRIDDMEKELYGLRRLKMYHKNLWETDLE